MGRDGRSCLTPNTMCDDLLEFKTWRRDDPKPLRGISYTTATRHLRILRKRLEKLMVKSTWKGDPPWSDLPKQQWELLCQGEDMRKKHGAHIWEYTTPHNPVDGRRWGPDESRPSPQCKEGVSVFEEYYTSISEPSGLETHPGGGPSGRCQRLGYLPSIHPVARATSGQSHSITGSGRSYKRLHLRTIQSDTHGRIGGSQETPYG